MQYDGALTQSRTLKTRSVFALAVLGAVLCLACSALAQEFAFDVANVTTGNGPASVIAVDINADGRPGLVTANFGFRNAGAFPTGGGSGTTLSVLTNDGSGNLFPSATLNVGFEPDAMATADVNGDGFPDLICANIGDNDITVLTNNRKGGFAFSAAFPVGNAPSFVASADVNGDGSIDLIVANYNDNTLSIFINNGHGNFSSGGTITTGSQPSCIAAADFNGDGKVDLVCANSGSGTMMVLTNNGHGAFTKTATISLSSGAGYVIGTDVNHDGAVDIVTANGVIDVFINDGHGNFTLKTSVPAVGTGTISAADMNGDGHIDLIGPVNGDGIQGSGSVWTNDGRGNFKLGGVVPIGIYSIGNYPENVAPADFNGDGNPDFAVSCFGSAVVTVLTQTSVTPRPIVTITSPANDSVISVSDGFTISATALSSSNIEVMIYYLGTNILASSTNAPFDVQIAAGKVPAGTHALQAVAFDSAGHKGWSSEVQINVGSTQQQPPPVVTTLTFSKTTLAVGNGPSFVLPVDLNGDSKIDLVTPNYGYAPYGCVGTYNGNAGTNMTVWMNNGQGAFASKVTIPVGAAGFGFYPDPDCVAAADLNGDGQIELIEPNFYFNTVDVFTNNGKGVFGYASSYIPNDRGPVYMTTADVNGDGKPDIIAANDYDSDLVVLTNAGNFTFGKSVTNSVGFAPAWVAVADVNGDGNLDLISADYGDCGDGNTLTTFIGDGHGKFTASATNTVPYGPICVVAADVNGDGKIDLVSANQIGNCLTVLTNDGHGKFTLKANIPINAPACIVATNISGSGKIDLACVSRDNPSITGTGTVTVFVNDGQGNFTASAVVSVGPLKDTLYPNRIAAADFNRDGKMDLVVANYGANSLTVLTQTTVRKPAPTVSLVSPTNGASYLTTQNIAVTPSVSSTALDVELYVDGEIFGSSASAPFGFQISAGKLSPGGHTLQAVAFDSLNQSGVSPAVNFTINAPGTALIDFDPVNTTAGAVGGAPLANYLAGYGVTLANVTAGTVMEAVNTNSLTGSIQVAVPSAPNFFTQAGAGQAESFTLRFASPLLSFGFARAGLTAKTGLVSHPQWSATAFDAAGNELSSVGEALIVSASAVAARTFVLTGNGIAAVRFDSDSQQSAAFSGVLLDDLLLNQNAVAPALSVSLLVVSPPTNDIVAPANLTLHATVNDQVSSSFYVQFFAGAQLLGVSGAAPYKIIVNGVLPGQYDLQARVVDSTGLTAQSQVMPITVQAGADSTLMNFDTLLATRGPVEGQSLNQYLATYGVSVANVSGGTQLAVESQQIIAGGQAVLASSAPNVLTQLGSNGPVQFTLRFSPLLGQFGFTRPELLANPFVSHPAWQITALDGAGVVVGQVEEGEIDSATNVGAREFNMSAAVGGPGIAEAVFSSQGTGLTTFNGMLADDFVLTTNKTAFAPAVAITQPVAGQSLAAPPALAITANAFDAAGITGVSFYAGPTLIGWAKTAPYTVVWTNPPPRPTSPYPLRAIATNALGLSWTSPLVRITILPSAYQFAITGQPLSQTIAAGGSATFAVTFSGTNDPACQWYLNGKPIPGATSSTFILPPPLGDDDAGSYTVGVTANGTTLMSQPAQLTVVDPPVFTTQPLGRTVSPGSALAFRPVATTAGGTALTWQWYLNGTPIPGATTRIYTITSAQPIQSGNYQVVAANQAASAASAVAPLVVETPATITQNNDNFANRTSINPLAGPVSASNVLATVETGEPLLGGKAGGKSIWFTWHASFTGTISLTTAGSDFDTLLGIYTGTVLKTLKTVAADDDSGGYLSSEVTFNVTAGTDYQIQVEGYEGASGRVVLGTPAGTGYQALNPSSGTSVPVIAHGPASKTVAPNASVTFTVQATGVGKITYQWYFQGAPIAGATKNSFVISHVQPGAVGMYSVVAANAAGSAASEPADLEIGSAPGGTVSSTENKFVETSGPPTPKLLARVLRPLALGGGDTRGFSVAQTFSTVGAGSEPGQPEPCGQVGGASQWFVYTAPAAGMLQISATGSTFNTLLGVYTGSGESFETLEEAGCGYTTNFAVEGQPSVVLPEVAKGTAFYILVDGYHGAAGLVRLQIGLGQPLSFVSVPTNRTVTAGGSTIFKVTPVGSTPFTYQWQLNGASLSGATRSSYTVSGAQQKVVGNYTVVVSNVIGAVTSSPPAALIVQYAPDILTGPTNLVVRLGQAARFSVTALGVNVRTNPFVCQWFFSNAPLPKATSLTYSIPVTHLTNEGPYYLVISNSYGAVTSALFTLAFVGQEQPPSPAQPNLHEATAAEKFAAASGTYSGLFYPADGATQASSGFLTATVAQKAAGTFSANLLLDGGSYPFSGKFDTSGDAQSLIARTGKTAVSAALHLDVDPADGRMSGQISSADWQSILQAGRAAGNTPVEASGQYAVVVSSGTNAPIGYLTLTNLTGATALVSGTLSDSASVIRSAPIIKGSAIPLYAPLYTGKGLFLGWISFTNTPGQIMPSAAWWIKPGSNNATPVLIVK